MKESIIYDEWLSKILDRKVYKIIVDATNVENIKKSTKIKKILKQKAVFAYAKVPTNSIAHIKFLENLGFSLVDTNVLFEKKIRVLNKKVSGRGIRFAQAKDEVDIINLASQSFEYSRFHLDDFFPKKLANTIKGDWVRNFFLGKRGDKMIVAQKGKSIAGFLLVLEEKKGIIIDLIAVDKGFRRQGIASKMISYLEKVFYGSQRIIVGTQISNIASMKLYENFGFRVFESSYVFHYHKQ